MSESREANGDTPTPAETVDYLLSGEAWGILTNGVYWTLELPATEDRAHGAVIRYDATVQGARWHLLGHLDTTAAGSGERRPRLLRWTAHTDRTPARRWVCERSCDPDAAVAWASTLVRT